MCVCVCVCVCVMLDLYISVIRSVPIFYAIQILVISLFMMYIQEGSSALMVAAVRGETGVVKELMKGGADLNLQNNVCQ